MPDYGGALKKFRASGYPSPEEKGGGEGGGVRSIKLTDEESKSLIPYQEQFGPGEEMVVEVSGKLEGTTFRVMSVRYAAGGAEKPDVDADAEEAMSKYRGIGSVPSPS